MNQFLKSRQQIDEATRWLQSNGKIEHPISCKNWELAEILKTLDGKGDILDMGADGSFILHNVTNTRRVGIDLAVVEGVNKAEGAEYHQGDLMHTPFKSGEFDVIVSQSVIEHNVDLEAFAKEASRLLRPGGRLIVSFDYWPTKVDTTGKKLYGLDWNILSKQDVIDLLVACGDNELAMSSPPFWDVDEQVINPQYCSPFSGISYTFGLFEFIKAKPWSE